MKYKLKVGDKVRLTPNRFLAFGNGQGVKASGPRTTYVIHRIDGVKRENPTYFTYMPDKHEQGHGIDDLVKVNKPILII
jgi:hypothetical protein